MTDQEIVEILATNGMGWPASIEIHGGKGVRCRMEWWNPLTDLNAIHEVEERLTDEQRRKYGFTLYDLLSLWDVDEDRIDVTWVIRHAPARTCAEALAKVLWRKC
jgi:hypothetical protein